MREAARITFECKGQIKSAQAAAIQHVSKQEHTPGEFKADGIAPSMRFPSISVGSAACGAPWGGDALVQEGKRCRDASAPLLTLSRRGLDVTGSNDA